MQLKAWKRAEEKARAVSTPEETHDIMEAARAETQVPAGAVATQARKLCFDGSISCVFDSTLRILQVARDTFADCKKRGFRVCVILVDTDVEVCQQRVKEREKKTGRPVQEEFVRSCNAESKEVAEAVKSEVDLFITIPNNDQPEVSDADKTRLRAFTQQPRASSSFSTSTLASMLGRSSSIAKE